MAVVPLTMPRMGLTMEEGRLLRWLKAPGEPVRRGEPVAEIETDKAVMEVEAPLDGFLRAVLVGPEETVRVGTNLALFSESAAEELAPAVPPAPAPAPAPSDDGPALPRPAPAAGGGAEVRGPVRASPAVRREARRRGIELAGIRGSGPRGRVVLRDLEGVGQEAGGGAAETPRARQGAAEAPGAGAPRPEPARRQELSRMRRAVARSMLRSWRSAPQFSVRRSFDAGAVEELRRALSGQLGRGGPLHLSLTDFLVQAVARTLPGFPALNATFEEEEGEGEGALLLHEEVALGLATVLEGGGLLVPVLHHAERLALGEIALERARLVEAARSGRLPPEALSGGTFTLSNLGPFGVDDFRAICSPGETAILAVGAVRERPVARGGQVAVRLVATLTLTVDHRAADGAEAARFLAALVERLESREGWLLF